jgi:hypothetical protein
MWGGGSVWSGRYIPKGRNAIYISVPRALSARIFLDGLTLMEATATSMRRMVPVNVLARVVRMTDTLPMMLAVSVAVVSLSECF